MLKKIIEIEKNKYAKIFYTLLLDEGYTLIGNSRYISAREHVALICPEGHEYKVAPHSFKSGNRCKKCSDKKKNKHLKHESELRFLNKLSEEGYISLSKYEGANEHVKVKCKNNHIYNVTPANFMYGYRCMGCRGERTIHDNSYEFHAKIKEAGYSLKGEYKGRNLKVETLCPNGHTYKVSPNSFVSGGNRCPDCRKEEIGKKFNNELSKEGYSLIGDGYKKMKTSVCVKCPKGHVYETTPNNFFHGRRCIKCQCSKGEKDIENFLKLKGFDFVAQKRFGECKNKRSLPFDFAVYFENKLLCLIEYQGQQHYKPADYFGGYKSFEQTVHNDNIKRMYCNKRNIPLIEIPYWETENIKEILEKELKTQ